MLLLAFAIFIFLSCTNKNRTWSVYKADAASSSYSPLRQVNRDNVHLLRAAWTLAPMMLQRTHILEPVNLIP